MVRFFPSRRRARAFLPSLLERNRRVRPMHLIDVDDIGLEAAKRIFELLAEPRRRRVAQDLAASPVEPDLGGDDRTFSAAALKRLTDQFLGTAEAIDRRGVDEIDAVVERGVNRADRVAFLRAAPQPSADGPGAKSDARGIEGQAGDLDVFHVVLPDFIAGAALAGPRRLQRGSTHQEAPEVSVLTVAGCFRQ